MWTGLIILATVLLVVELIVEVVGLMNRRYKPVLNLYLVGFVTVKKMIKSN
ncbi:MAG: hypothetical protein LRY73_11005 [Bacillus sp. (in: Bacteria)]|nr:hypothetical protein [Bacillus sp. (in: firmicutes)]